MPRLPGTTEAGNASKASNRDRHGASRGIGAGVTGLPGPRLSRHRQSFGFADSSFVLPEGSPWWTGTYGQVSTAMRIGERQQRARILRFCYSRVLFAIVGAIVDTVIKTIERNVHLVRVQRVGTSRPNG